MQTGEETRQVGKMEIKKKKRISWYHCASVGNILPYAGKTGITGIPLAGNYSTGSFDKSNVVQVISYKSLRVLGVLAKS